MELVQKLQAIRNRLTELQFAIDAIKSASENDRIWHQCHTATVYADEIGKCADNIERIIVVAN
jgi:hypothetical protein